LSARISFADLSALTFMNMASFLILQAPGGAGGLSFLLMMGLMIGVFYFLLILPNQRRQKKWQAVVDALKTGDKVTTSGGLRGVIVAMKDDAIHLRVPPDNLRVEVTKASVMHVTTADDEVKTK
jgi:preprotein translocase subunit YajC